MIQYIPFMGLVIEGVRVRHEQQACLHAADPFGSICIHEREVFNDFNTAFIVTMAASMVAIIALHLALYRLWRRLSGN